ncbi:MAG: molybdopterin molybdotransferase MoeA [Planctomycetes bacterium]|nr:molybdopterin molybdotransferase MoeA [Planctomycetota bacterium]
MITIDEALERVLREVVSFPAETVALGDALGRVLAEDRLSDIDSPPHDKALVDGYAVVASDIRRGVELEVVEQIMAGQTPRLGVRPSRASRIMTGAPIPDGADAVVMVERTECPNGADRVRVLQDRATAGENILRRAAAMRAGERVVERGRLVRPVEIGVLAESGCARVPVCPRPRVAVLATGDELVDASEVPGAGRIRNSNGPMLAALASRAGGRVTDLGVARDETDALGRAIREGLDSDMLLIAGGVSAGVLDLIPSVLRDVGAKAVFHRVRLRPGKPVWFGVFAHPDRSTLIFGLPGNPVSALVCFELLARPALERMAGVPHDANRRRRAARLGAAFSHRGDRTTCFPARLFEDERGRVAVPLDWKGSPDIRTLADADAFIVFPPGDRAYAEEDPIDVYLLGGTGR